MYFEEFNQRPSHLQRDWIMHVNEELVLELGKDSEPNKRAVDIIKDAVIFCHVPIVLI